jgi:hypothetical protein
MLDYMKSVVNDAHMSFIYFSIIIFTFFSLSNTDDNRHRFLIILFVIVSVIYYYNFSKNNLDTKKRIIDKFSKNQETVKGIEFVLPGVFQFHHNPPKIKYIKHNQNLMNIINELSFIKTYDHASYEMIVILCEYFFKVYYNILDKRYSCIQYVSIMADLRKEILNLFAGLYFAVPQISKHIDGNAWEIIDRNNKKIQAITFRCMKIISHYIKSTCNITYSYKGPQPVDPISNNHLLY